LLKFADMKRFGDSPAVEINNVTAPLISDDIAARVIALFQRQKALAAQSAPKQIQAAEIMPERVVKNE